MSRVAPSFHNLLVSQDFPHSWGQRPRQRGMLIPVEVYAIDHTRPSDGIDIEEVRGPCLAGIPVSFDVSKATLWRSLEFARDRTLRFPDDRRRQHKNLRRRHTWLHRRSPDDVYKRTDAKR